MSEGKISKKIAKVLIGYEIKGRYNQNMNLSSFLKISKV